MFVDGAFSERDNTILSPKILTSHTASISLAASFQFDLISKALNINILQLKLDFLIIRSGDELILVVSEKRSTIV